MAHEFAYPRPRQRSLRLRDFSLRPRQGGTVPPAIPNG